MRVRGFTLFEFVLVIILIGVLSTFAIHRMLVLRASAEHTAVELTIASMRRALATEVVSAISKGRPLDSLVGTNPLKLLHHEGEETLLITGISHPELMPEGAWYFDRGTGVLTYKVRYPLYFYSLAPGPDRIRLKVEADKVFDRKKRKDVVKDLYLRALEPYRWCEEADVGYCSKWGKLHK